MLRFIDLFLYRLRLAQGRSRRFGLTCNENAESALSVPLQDLLISAGEKCRSFIRARLSRLMLRLPHLELSRQMKSSMRATHMFAASNGYTEGHGKAIGTLSCGLYMLSIPSELIFRIAHYRICPYCTKKEISMGLLPRGKEAVESMT